jgi:hypothetical protein
VYQRRRRRRDVHAFGDQLVEHLGRHVFVVERQRIGTDRRTPQRIEVVVRTDHHIRSHLRCRIIGCDGQHT